MPSYIIAIRNSTTDAEALETYRAQVGAARRPDMTTLAAYGRSEALEGPPTEGVVLIEFPTYEAAKAWYESEAYQKASEHRRAGADYRFILFEGR